MTHEIVTVMFGVSLLARAPASVARFSLSSTCDLVVHLFRAESNLNRRVRGVAAPLTRPNIRRTCFVQTNNCARVRLWQIAGIQVGCEWHRYRWCGTRHRGMVSGIIRS